MLILMKEKSSFMFYVLKLYYFAPTLRTLFIGQRLLMKSLKHQLCATYIGDQMKNEHEFRL